MPSMLVHLALSGVIAAALLGRIFEWRALAVVLGVTIVADLDAFVGLYVEGAHRAAFHTLLIPLAIAAFLLYDSNIRENSLIAGRYGTWGLQVAWVSVATYVFSIIGLDLVTSPVNLVYPLHDEFFVLDGNLFYSTQRGLVQTFLEIQEATGGGGVPAPKPDSVGNTSTVHVSTGVDPTSGSDPNDVERIFPVAQSGWQLLILVGGTVITAARLGLNGSLSPRM